MLTPCGVDSSRTVDRILCAARAPRDFIDLFPPRISTQRDLRSRPMEMYWITFLEAS